MSMQCRASPEPPVSVEGDERERGGERGAEEADELRRREPADVRVECSLCTPILSPLERYYKAFKFDTAFKFQYKRSHLW